MNFSDYDELLRSRRERYARSLADAKHRYPVGTYALVHDGDGYAFWGRVNGYEPNIGGRLLVQVGQNVCYVGEIARQLDDLECRVLDHVAKREGWITVNEAVEAIDRF